MCGTVGSGGGGGGGVVTFLLQGELPLVLYVLQRGGQVPGQTACAVGPQKGTLWDTRITTS